MPRLLAIRQIEQRFRERKLQHDLAVVVGDLDDSVHQGAVGTLALDELEDHGARDFPGAIRIAQFLALGIIDQFIADPGVEKVSWHAVSNGAGGSELEAAPFSQVLYPALPLPFNALPIGDQ